MKRTWVSIFFCLFCFAAISVSYADAESASTEDQVDVPLGDIGEQPDPDFVALPYGSTLLGNLGGTAVITSPFIHSRYQYSGSGLIVNYSSIHKDVGILLQRRNFENQMHDSGLSMPGYPLLELSGEVEGSFFAARDYTGGHSSDINLTDAELDMQALINHWFTGFISFAYDSSDPIMGSRVSNSDVFVDNAFITLGNFNHSPFFATVGQMYVPFGQFDSYLITDPIGKRLFRTKARPIELGYRSLEDSGFFASIYAFRGDAREGRFNPTDSTRSANDHINQYGTNLGYLFTTEGGLQGTFALSYINNVADAAGMQSTGGGTFGGFGVSNATEVLDHRVAGFDALAEFNYSAYSFIAEYSTALDSFSPVDLTYNGNGAKPQAFHIEGVYHFSPWEKPTSLAIAYDRTKDSLALNVPEERFGIGLATSLWRNTLLSFEVKRENDYGSGDTASGSFGPTFAGTGGHAHVFTTQFDIYF